MVADDERRRVAEMLRKYDGPSLMVLMSVLGVGGDRVLDRLADLIEPGEPEVKCVAEVKIDGERLEQLVHDAAVELTGIDRDALLELADDLDRMGDGSMYDPCISDEYGIARRIREALGVQNA